MKIINNYDLIEKVNDSKGELYIPRLILRSAKETAPYSCIMLGIDLLPGMNDGEIGWVSIAIRSAIIMAMRIFFYSAISDFSKSNFTSKADSELLRLLSKLRESGVKTDLELLKESKEDLVEYKFISEDSRIKLRENKYILVPTNDGFGGTKDVSVLQEHNVGSKVYVLSLGSPKKYAKPVRVYN